MLSPTLRYSVVASVLALATAGACTNDYDAFDIGAGATAGSGGSAGTAGTGGGGTGGGGVGGEATGGSGGVTGGTGGVTTGGVGGVTTGGTGGVGGTDGGIEGGVAGTAGLDGGPDAGGAAGAGGSGPTGGAGGGAPEAGCASTDVVTDCGACGRTCDTAGTDQLVCTPGGTCASSCQLGFANCSRPPTGPDDGCETAASADNANCGGCGSTCTGLTCQNSLCGCGSTAECELTTAGSAFCNTTTRLCTCNGTICHSGERCDGGCKCPGNVAGSGAACGAGQTCCSAGCFDLANDASNCGACGRACAPGQTCAAGQCQ